MSRREKTLLAGYIEELEKERDQLRKKVKMLRDALMHIAVDDCGCGAPCDCYSWSSLADKAKEALAKVRKS